MTYDRGSIAGWFRKRAAQGQPLTCPSTNQVVSSPHSTPNTALQAQVKEWLRQSQLQPATVGGGATPWGGGEWEGEPAATLQCVTERVTGTDTVVPSTGNPFASPRVRVVILTVCAWYTYTHILCRHTCTRLQAAYIPVCIHHVGAHIPTQAQAPAPSWHAPSVAAVLAAAVQDAPRSRLPEAQWLQQRLQGPGEAGRVLQSGAVSHVVALTQRAEQATAGVSDL